MSLLALDRRAPRTRPARAPHIGIDVVRDLNGLVGVIALRALVFMGEQACPLNEEFDGNDLTAATHLVANIDGEPVATLRLRWFADFVKFERVLVKFEHRRKETEIARRLIDAATTLARRRGYRRALAYAQVRLKSFWTRMGFCLRPARKGFAFSDHDYVEFEAQFPAHPQRLHIDSDPLVLLRPDGKWDEPGILDHSTSRPVSNPHR